MIFRRFLNTIQSEEKSFEIPKNHKTEGRAKIAEIAPEGLPHAPLRMRPCAPVHRGALATSPCALLID